jgi:hypothetical protein
MGLIVELLLVPVAPVRAIGWIADVLLDEADRRMAADASPARALEELAAAAANGEIDQQVAEALEAEIVERMLLADDPAASP